jgi:hypothetical protein
MTKGGTQKLPKKSRMSKPTDMTIHWKALEEHILMVPFVFRFNFLWGKSAVAKHPLVIIIKLYKGW